MFLRLSTLVLVLLGGFLAARWAMHAFASDETKIRWVVEDMAEGFDEGHASEATEGLAEDWSHEDSRLDRDLLHGILRHEVVSYLGDEDRSWDLRVEVPEDELAIEVDGDAARLVAEPRFFRVDGAAKEEVWRVRVEAELERRGEGWRIVRSRHEELGGPGLR